MGVRIERRGRYFYVDLRRWDAGRPTMRDPGHPGWPDEGRKTSDLAVAERWAQAYKEHYELGPILGLTSREFLRHRAGTVAHKTWTNDKCHVGKVVEHFGHDTPMAHITSSDLQECFDGMAESMSPGSLKTYRNTVRLLWSYAGFPKPKIVIQECRTSVVYLVQCQATGRVKIGLTNHLRRRIRSLRSMIPTEIELLATAEGDEEREKELHERFAAARIKGEWFEPDVAEAARAYLEGDR